MTAPCWQWDLPDDLTAPAVGRAHAREVLGGHPHLEDVELVISELVTNAIRHGQPPVRMTLATTDQHVRITVTDSGSGPSSETAPDTDSLTDTAVESRHDPGGRGLMIVSALCGQHGGHYTASGWESWAVIDGSGGTVRSVS